MHGPGEELQIGRISVGSVKFVSGGRESGGCYMHSPATALENLGVDLCAAFALRSRPGGGPLGRRSNVGTLERAHWSDSIGTHKWVLNDEGKQRPEDEDVENFRVQGSSPDLG